MKQTTFLYLLAWTILFASLTAACSASPPKNHVSTNELITELRQEPARIGEKIDTHDGLVVVAFTRIHPGEVYPELGCIIGEGYNQDSTSYGTMRMTTYAFEITEKLADRPLLILEDHFGDYQVTCLFVRADVLAPHLRVTLTKMDGTIQEITNPNQYGTVIVRKETPRTAVYRQYQLVDGSGNVIHQTTKPDKGFP